MKYSTQIQTVSLISLLFLNIFSNIVVAPHVTPSSVISELGLQLGIADAETPMIYGDYKIYSEIAGNEEWAKIVIQDIHGENLDTSVINVGEVKSFSRSGIDVAVTGITASEDGSLIETDLAVDLKGKLIIGTITTEKPFYLPSIICPYIGSGDNWVKMKIKNRNDVLLESSTIKKGETKSLDSGISIYVSDIQAQEDGKVKSVSFIVWKKDAFNSSYTLENNECAEYPTYQITSSLASNDSWARILVESYGESVDSITMYKGETRDLKTLGMRVGVVDVVAEKTGVAKKVTIVLGTFSDKKIPVLKKIVPSPPVDKKSCQKNTDCPKGMKCMIPLCGIDGCGDDKTYICEDVGCIGRGSAVPGGDISLEARDHMATECCKGLDMIGRGAYYDEKCEFDMPMDGSILICSDCGNGICEDKWESKCNCPKDCDGEQPKKIKPITIKCESGCLVDNKCLPYGYRKSGKYCDISNIMIEQKIGDINCDNSFECNSNSCFDDKCVREGLIEKILKWLSNFLEQ